MKVSNNNEYNNEVIYRWGNTEAYKEHSEKTNN